MAMEKMNTMSLGEKLIAGGGILMLIASFLPWYKISIDFGALGDLIGESGTSVSRSGWQSPGAIWSELAVLVAVILALSVILPKFANMVLPALPTGMTWGMVYGGGAAIIVLCIVLKFLGESSYMSIGFYLGIIAAAIIAFGGYLLYQTDRAYTRPA